MSLSSALFSGISGLSTLGNSMTVIGDNIANVNTVGFKGSRVTFQDVLSQTVATTAGTAQVGRGTSLADICSSFSQGSFESTDSTTDLAIGGEGFFVVRDPNNEENQFYTRAGEFRFDKDGNFTNPAGYIVRGWELDADTGEDKGSITDVVLQSFTSSPKKTDRLTLITNLDADATDNSTTLSSVWDGADANDNYISENAYEYQTTLKVYDSLGSTHDITIYFDKGDSTTEYEYFAVCNPDEDKRKDIDTTQSGVGMLGRGTITFSEDSGAITDINFEAFNASNTLTDIGTPVETQYGPTTPVASGTYTGTSTLTYTFTVDTVGAIDGATAKMDWTDGTDSGTITLDGAAQAVGSLGLNVDFGEDTDAIGPVGNLTWNSAAADPVSSGTYIGTSDATYLFEIMTTGELGVATFRYSTDAGATWTPAAPGPYTVATGGGQAIADGLTITWSADVVGDDLIVGDTFTVDCTASEFLATGDTFTVTCYTDNEVGNSNCWDTKSEAVADDLSNGYFFCTADFLGSLTTDTSMDIELDFGSAYSGGSWTNDSLSTTQYSSASTTTFQSANGYGAGDLQSITVATDGAMTGQYSNGQVIPLFRVALAKFQNNQALFKVGGNLFRETRLSGDPTTSKPGTNGLGSLSPNSLEQSNVDIATEFVKMITTQRGFQANSKIITVTDQMLAELINLKR